MANGTTIHQNNGPVAKRLGQETVHSIGNPPHMGDGAVGVLSQTIIPSTTVRWILPARIRHPDHNDVVFVCESFVQLRELLPARHLANIPERLEMGCRILAAKVISHVDSTPFIDQVVKQEEREEEESKSALPSQILVLTLDFCEIAFVYAEDVAPNRIRFKVARWKLPADVSSLGQYGRHLAVDSKSCTIAVSPAYGQFGIVRLKTIPELREQISAYDTNRPEAFVPLKEERFVQVDGLILRMEFLLSSSTAKAKTVLALLVSKNEATHVYLYSWGEKAPLRTAKLESCGPHRLPDKDRMPLLMIPSNHNASFTLVTDSGLTVYDDVLSSDYRTIHVELPHTFPSNFVGSRRSPLWVQWAKPCRHIEYLKTNDDFYLVREDGRLEYFEIMHNTPSKVQNGGDVGSINIAVDTAFAILEAPLDQGGDLCVVGGDMTDGAVCHMMARKPLDRFQTITNLAPLRDMLILDNTSRDKDASRMFVCSGKGEGHAAVAEIRHGLEARIGSIVEQEDSSVVTGLWVLPEAIWDHLTILVSYPLQTLALRINLKEAALETADDELAKQGLQLSSQTLALAVIQQGLLVQITSSTITIFAPLSKMGSVDMKHAKCPVSIASIGPDDMLIATVTMVNDIFRVLLSSIDVDDTGISINDFSTAYSMAEEPSSILIADVSDIQLLIVGTIVGSVHVLEIEQGRGVRLLSRHSIATLFPHVEPSAICSLVSLADPALGLPALACGTRNGWLLGMTIVWTLPALRPEDRKLPGVLQGEPNGLPNDVTLRPECAQHIGQTSVELTSDPEDKSAAMLFCDFEVHRLSYTQSDWAASFKVSRIWFTDVAQPEFDQPEISAVAALHRHASSGMNHLEATLVCVTKSDLLVSSLSLEPSIVPRRTMLSGDPHKMVYAKGLGKFVVAINQTKLIADRAPERLARRIIRPGIQFLDPDHRGSSSAHKHVVLLGQAGSRITSMLSWTATDGKKNVEMIVVGLYIDGPDTAHCDGRIVYLTAVKNGQANSDLDIDIKRTARLVGCPIYSLAQYSHSSLVVCAGTDLFLQSQDLSTRNWTRTARYPLPSPAVSLHVSGRFIYATTARHSLKVFEVEGAELKLRAQETRTRDAIRDATHFVGTAEGGVLAVANNKGGRVLGYSKQERGDFSLLFDASLPLTVNCLREACQDGSITKNGKKYYGSTQDGALYQFTVLSRREWKFLNFIAGLAWKKPATESKIKRKSSSVQRKERKRTRPMDMHINGDHIVDLLHSGPRELRRLLEEPSRPDNPGQGSLSPDQRLKELSALGQPLFGTGEDPVLAASRWMQKLVNNAE